ncbi:MerR family transcriptional regulator, partial [Patescibacteria group bacterium]
ISPSTLRRLEKKSILVPKRNEAGERVYSRSIIDDFKKSEYFTLKKSDLPKKDLDKVPAKYKSGSGRDLSDTRTLTSIVVDEHSKELRTLEKYKDTFIVAITAVGLIMLLTIIAITALFIAYPYETSEYFGYVYEGEEIAINQSAVGSMVLGETDDTTSKTRAEVIKSTLTPFSRISLNLVGVIDPETYQKIKRPIPQSDIAQNVFIYDTEGNIVPLSDIKLPAGISLKSDDIDSIEQTVVDITNTLEGQDLSRFVVLDEFGRVSALRITSTNLEEDQVLTVAINDGAVTTTKLSDAGVTEAKLADDAVTREKVADNAIATGNIADGEVGSSDLADNSVTTTDLASLLEFAGGDLLDLSDITHSNTTNQGILLPNTSSASPSEPTSGEGYLAFDTAGDQVIVYDGSSWTQVGSGDITAVTVGNGLSGGGTSGDLSIGLDVTTSGTTGTSSANSGLETASDGLSLLRGCSDNEILKWDAGSSVWGCEADTGAGASSLELEEGDVTVDSSVANIDFLAADFILTESPEDEINISIDYTNSNIVRSNQSESITSAWTFSNTLDLTGIGATTDNTILIITPDGSVGTDEIDSRVWGSNLLEDSDIGSTVQAYSANTTILGPSIDLASEVGGTLPLANGGTGASLSDPGVDRILFWDDGGSTTGWLAPDGSSIEISGTTLRHFDTSSQSSSDNSGTTVIQDITLDSYGHISGLATTDLSGSLDNYSSWTVGD